MNAGLLPGPLRRYVLDFERRIEEAVGAFAAGLPAGARVLDAGAGEGAYKAHFPLQRYTGLDLGIGDTAWDYTQLDVLGDLSALPFCNGVFDAALNIVTLEHVREPQRVMDELARVLRPGGRLLLVVPHEWEVHQHPHDFFRYTKFGVEELARKAGLRVISLQAGGGYFRLLARRMLSGAQYFSAPFQLLWLAAVAPAALLLPLLDGLDRRQDFTLGYLAVLENGRE
ncbi:MAG TPA: class I SAM-dependent methyltransferase [Bryobacteraceae bacterium]|nr:class I SAM-dependent methyltransferase [Bryobacteraceae bacterium]